MPTLLALDMDGTLLRTDLSISARTMNAIKAAQASGISITLATGRTYTSALRYAMQLDLTVPIVACNGAMVRGFDSVLCHRPIKLNTAKALSAEAEKRGLYVKAYVDDVLTTATVDERTLVFAQDHGLNVRGVGLLSADLDADPTMVVVSASPDLISEFKRDVLGNMADVHGVSSSGESVDIITAGCTKASGLAILASLLNIEARNVIAIGNAENDISMIEWAGLGVAVHGADIELAKKADLVLSQTNDMDGVADFIFTHLLKHGGIVHDSDQDG